MNEAIGGILTTVSASWSLLDKKEGLNERNEH
jgi:hypothetical protein